MEWQRLMQRRALLLVLGLIAAASLSVACGQRVIIGPDEQELQEQIDAALAERGEGGALPSGLSTGFDAAEPAQTVQAVLVAPPGVPPPVDRDAAARVVVDFETVEQVGRLADGTEYEFWSFNETVPGPMIRVRAGDVVQINLTNRGDSSASHNIDLHAVNGPGGGAEATLVAPGETKSFEFKALAPGLYVYHCAVAPVAHHIASGMYGMILVEPEEGLPPVDDEFYVMQQEVYTAGERGQQGLRAFDMDAMLDENPEFVVFNGAAGSLLGDNALTTAVGNDVRIYFGVGGPNLISSFHVIGEIFDTVYQEASFSAIAKNVQTTLVPPGGATAVEFHVDVPGTYLLVDHALGRAIKGAAGQLVATGAEDPAVFRPLTATEPADHAEPDAAAAIDDATAAPDVEEGRVIEVVMQEFEYSPAIRVTAGERVTLVIRNDGSVVHDITSDDFRGQVFAASGAAHMAEEVGTGFHAAANPGETARLTFMAEEPGEFTIYCSVPGHQALGMQATVIVDA